MDEREQFKRDCRLYFKDVILGELRSYGREVGVESPTKLKKSELIEEILAILTKEKEPVPRSNKGAPVLAKGVDARVLERVDALRRYYKIPLYSEVKMGKDGIILPDDFDDLPEGYKTIFNSKLEFHSSADVDAQLYAGQFQKLDNVCWILPLDCVDKGQNILISDTLASLYGLVEGDEVKCYAVPSSKALVAKEITEINGCSLSQLKRSEFEKQDILLPNERITFSDGVRYASETLKFMQWLVPVCKGQRGCVIASPKVGKTKILLQIADAVASLNEDVQVFALLVDQTPETVAEYRKAVSADKLLSTTYDDDSDRQIFVAEYLLRRVKRYAECGKDVLLIVDSLNALAHAYNDTEASVGGKTLACGLESKTLHYVKKFFGTARRLQSGGSVTVLGAVTINSGNPADDAVASELSNISNVEIRLDDELAKKRVFPSLNVSGVSVKQNDGLRSPQEDKLDLFLRKQEGVLSQEEILRAFVWSKTAEEALERLK